MKKTWLAIILLGFIVPLPAAIEPFTRGQLFISAYAGFIPNSNNGWDVMYNLCFESAVSRNVSIGFAYSQKQSHAGESQDQLVIPLNTGAPSQPDVYDKSLLYADSTTRLFCLEGKYHIALAAIRRLDLFCGAGFGLELNKTNSLQFTLIPSAAESSSAELDIRHVDKNRYYLVANFFGGVNYYLADNLALAAKLGYQYSGISDYNSILSVGITFRIH